MKLRTKITVAVVVHITLMLLIVTALSWLVLNKTSEAKTLDILKANVSNFSGQINSWLDVEAQKVSDLAYTFKEGEYLTNNRDDMYDALVRGLKEAPEFYALYIGCEDNFARFSDGWIPDADYTITERQWYIDAKASTGVIITDPYIDVGTNRMVITVAKAIHDDNGKTQGVIAADIFIDELQEISKSFNSMEGASPVLVSQEGVVIIHNNSEFLPCVDSDGNEVYIDYNDTIKNKGLTNTIDGFSHFMCTGVDDNINRYVVSTIIPTSNWTMYYGLDTSVMYADSIKMGTIYAILIPSILLVSLFGVILVLGICFKPLRNVEYEANKLVDGDLSVAFDYKINDEIGTVCRIIEDTNCIIKMYVDDITEQLHKMQDGNFSEISDMNYNGDFAPIKISFEAIVDALNKAFIEISDVADMVSADADSFSQGASNLAESSTTQAALIEEINVDVSSTISKIRGTLELTNKAKSVADDTKVNVAQSNDQMNKLLEAMQEIEKSSAEICSMNKVIEDIAFQTNILALNASVEAARAGASGKGFAVVADEVRNLAGKSAEAANKTNKLIERSSEAVAKGLEYTNLTAHSLEVVQRQTNDVDNIINEIANSSKEQSISMSGISEKTERVSEQVMTLSASAEESASASVELNTQANKLRALINKFKLKK